MGEQVSTVTGSHLPKGLIVGTMCHCDDPDECDDHWELFYDVDGYDEETGHLRSGRQMNEAQMRAVADLVNAHADGSIGPVTDV